MGPQAESKGFAALVHSGLSQSSSAAKYASASWPFSLREDLISIEERGRGCLSS
jgi:hypothetical protein